MKKYSLSLSMDLLLEGNCRLDATFYESNVFKARSALQAHQQSGGEVVTVKYFSSNTFNPPPIKRAFTDDKTLGTPYMLPQEMYDFYWTPRKFVLTNKMQAIDDWFLKRGWVVLSQSGTVGKPYLAVKEDEDLVLSQNAIRLTCDNAEEGGYVYAYLSTWIGQTLLKKDEFGITVKHIRPHQVDAVPIPKATEEQRKLIGRKVKKAFDLRARAIRLIDEAKKEVCDILGVDVDIPEAEEIDDAQQ